MNIFFQSCIWPAAANVSVSGSAGQQQPLGDGHDDSGIYHSADVAAGATMTGQRKKRDFTTQLRPSASSVGKSNASGQRSQTKEGTVTSWQFLKPISTDAGTCPKPGVTHVWFLHRLRTLFWKKKGERKKRVYDISVSIDRPWFPLSPKALCERGTQDLVSSHFSRQPGDQVESLHLEIIT